jgi:tetratricopeptide (TPR) repeat protein
MRRILLCVLFGIISSASRIAAQDQSSGLARLSELSRHGQLPQLIQAANSLLASANLPPADQGIVLTYLGHAYQQSGDFARATAYYEKALAIINRDGRHPAEYATALGTLATLYAEMGQTDTAKHILLRSVRLFEKQDDHAHAAMIWNDLATIAADDRSSRDAHKSMARSIAESQLAANITPDQLAALTATQARIAELDGDPRTAVSDYQRSLALWKQSHEDRHPQTAWLYVLLGGAYLQAGDIVSAHENTSRGLTLLEASAGRQNPRFFAAQLAYSRVLDASGAHDQASNLRKQAESKLNLNTDADRHRALEQISISALR